MRPIATIVFNPTLPARLERLRDLAMNLHWAWDHDTVDLFRRLDPDRWEAVGHNPVRLLGQMDQPALEAAAIDEGFLAHLDRAASALDAYVSHPGTWFARVHGTSDSPLAAYFSAEFGITECLPIFAGGLGVLAGDYLKSASDLGVPMVGVGLLYRQGYFRQQITTAGRQQEVFEDTDVHALPVSTERTPQGNAVVVRIPFPGREVSARVWRARVGRVPLFLLDTDVSTNTAADRAITHRLYGGDEELRLQQEIVLGVGGVRALAELGIEPMVCHMNEGHSAFLALERARQLMQRHRIDFRAARELATAGLVFTTHTPVPAGHDRFSPDLMSRYFAAFARDLGVSWSEFLGLGRQRSHDDTEPFTMTVLALRLASYTNGVSRTHGGVSRRMWSDVWPTVPVDEIPIGHVTNGVHVPSWVSRGMADLYERYLGPHWRESPAECAVWERARRIPAEELWRTHERCRERLVALARSRFLNRLERLGAGTSELADSGDVLDPSALTVVFARRFATYKRAWLLFQDPDRLHRLISAPERPLQVIVAGKAHPRDEPGKELIYRIAALAREPRFRRHVVLLEDYDVAVARALVQGADVWLNTPLPPNEASGTSGMKAGVNGALNVSTTDGWWAEAWEDVVAREDSPVARLGWVVAEGDAARSAEERDRETADALYQLLERDVVPTFYDRGPDGLPRRWIDRMRCAITEIAARFGAHRMVREYAERVYIPAHASAASLSVSGAERARSLAEWRARLEEAWPQVCVETVEVHAPAELPVGTPVRIRALVRLGPLSDRDIRVQVLAGAVDADGDIREADITDLSGSRSTDGGPVPFEGALVARRASGLHGLAVRVLPRHPDLATCFLPGLITWARPESTRNGVSSSAAT